MRLETKPVTSIANAVIRKYEVNSSDTWLGDASSPLAMDGRIGSTSPIPMKATTDAPAVAQTAFGWRRSPAPVAPSSNGSSPCMGSLPLSFGLAGSMRYAQDKLDKLINASYTYFPRSEPRCGRVIVLDGTSGGEDGGGL